ncbi:MAG: hypothetical protein WCL61_02470, partial [bacterium]
MTLKQLLWVISASTAICWAIWLTILMGIDPFQAENTIAVILFYFCLFLALLGSFFLVSFGIRKLFSKLILDYKIVGTSIRQSVFFSLMTVGMLFLQSKGLLTWFNATFIILALTLVE